MNIILHICLCGPYSDGFSYQENILTKYHKRLGNEVYIVSSQYSWDHNGKIIKCCDTGYINSDGVMVIRLKQLVGGKFAKYKDFFSTIAHIKPNIIFVHGCNFSDLDKVRKYVKSHPTILYIDNHADETNSATNFVSKNILHKIIWRNKIRKIEPFVKCFYGVLPKRCDFLKNMYLIPDVKIKLLVMGLDDDCLLQPIVPILKSNDKIISIGGKIDEYKGNEICKFLDAFTKVKHAGFAVAIYGSIIEQFKDKILDYSNRFDGIHYLGWLNHSEIVNVIKNSSYCVFPGRHSVLWEEAVCLGKPIVVKYYEGYNHIDLGGNVVFLYETDVNYYCDIIRKIIDNDFLNEISKQSLKKERFKFLYSVIAKESIN